MRAAMRDAAARRPPAATAACAAARALRSDVLVLAQPCGSSTPSRRALDAARSMDRMVVSEHLNLFEQHPQPAAVAVRNRRPLLRSLSRTIATILARVRFVARLPTRVRVLLAVAAGCATLAVVVLSGDADKSRHRVLALAQAGRAQEGPSWRIAAEEHRGRVEAEERSLQERTTTTRPRHARHERTATKRRRARSTERRRSHKRRTASRPRARGATGYQATARPSPAPAPAPSAAAPRPASSPRVPQGSDEFGFEQ